MLNKEEARKIALTAIADSAKKSGLDYVIIEKLIVEKDFAWVFPFNTREYVETGNIKKIALGISPVVINRQSGAVVAVPHMPIANFLEQYEAKLKGI